MVADSEGLADEAGTREAGGVKAFGELPGCEAVAGCGEVGRGRAGVIIEGGEVRGAYVGFYLGELGVDGFGNAGGKGGG